MKHLVILAAFLFATAGLSACNTMEGLGEDIRAGGDKLDRSAEKHKNY